MSELSGPYALAFQALLDAGFNPIPLPTGQKYPPPSGVTGATGINPSVEQCQRWAVEQPFGNVGIRLNKGDATTGEPGVGVLDVDHYSKNGRVKRGADSIRAMSAELGVDLPPTWRSTSRGTDNPPGGYLYLVPGGTSISAECLDDVDALTWNHRYLVVAPSVHPEGRVYEWVTPDGSVSPVPPRLEALPYLPSTPAVVCDLPAGRSRM